jgi:hypothetical protein
MEITIRDGRQSDVDAIHEILVAESTIAGSMRPPYQAKVETLERLEKTEGMTCLVALIDDEIVDSSKWRPFPTRLDTDTSALST